MHRRLFDLCLSFYPGEFRAAFEAEMRAVLAGVSATRPGARTVLAEVLGLLAGAAAAHIACARAAGLGRIAASMAAGAGLAGTLQALIYRSLLCSLIAGIALSQALPKEDPAALETARSIYRAAFTALRDAKTMDDMRRLSRSLDSPEWISVDRFGRRVFDRAGAERDLESLLQLPPERRVTRMDIVWAEQDGGRLIVLAWMMPHEATLADTAGDYGPKGAKHTFTRGTLIRDLFEKTPDGWRRIRHDKLSPNGTVLAVDGAPRIVPPLPPHRQAAPAK